MNEHSSNSDPAVVVLRYAGTCYPASTRLRMARWQAGRLYLQGELGNFVREAQQPDRPADDTEAELWHGRDRQTPEHAR